MIVSPSLSPSHLKKPLAGQLEKNSNSVLMQDIFNKVLRLSRRETHVIIIGEIGTGKKWLARIIHENSQRARGPFHSLYCVDSDESDYRDAFWVQLHVDEDIETPKSDDTENATGGHAYP